jgi:hypothetical protein
MSDGYCAYCQSPVSADHPGKVPGQVEHLEPKSRFPARAYRVGNYFLGCMGCNLAKGDKWPAGGYVRPDQGEPSKRFVFGEDGSVKARPRDVQAKNMVRDLELDRRPGLTKLRRVLIAAQLEHVRVYLVANQHVPRKLRNKPPLVAVFSVVSEAINQNVRRVWVQGLRKGRP